MSYKPKYEYQQHSLSTAKQTLNEKEVKQIQRGNAKEIINNTIRTSQNNHGFKKIEMIKFYSLLLIQAIIIYVSYKVPMEDLYYDKILGAESNSASFKEYCKNTKYCQKTVDNNQKDGVKYQIWNYWPNQIHWISLIAYPLFLIFQQSIRNIMWLRKIAFLFTIISYPCLFMFVQILLIYIRKYFESLKGQIELVFWIYVANIVFFLLNKCISSMEYQKNEKVAYSAILAFIINVLYNQISSTSINWTFYILTTIYIVTYFIHIDNNLFKENKYIRENKMLIRIIIDKLLQPLQVEDNYRNIVKNHYVLNKNFTIFYAIIGTLFYWLVYHYQQEDMIITLVSILLIFVLWDTSLISTNTQFTTQNKCLAANLFFLDLFLPIRNIVILLLLD